MTLLFATPPSEPSRYWQQHQQQQQQQQHHAPMQMVASTTPKSASKRKRLSGSFDPSLPSTGSSSSSSFFNASSPLQFAGQNGARCSPAVYNADLATASESSNLSFSDAGGKRCRTNAPITSPRLLPSSPANVPFSSAFRSAAPASSRPPTVEEQQSWASSSTSLSQPIDSPAAGTYAPATTWVKVTTDYGHAWERCAQNEVDASTVREADEDMAMDASSEAAASLQPPPTVSLQGPGRPASERMDGTLWQHIEGDGETAMYDPDTSRRGDAVSWEEEEDRMAEGQQQSPPQPPPSVHQMAAGLAESQAKAANTTAAAHAAVSFYGRRAELGATYFDHLSWQAGH